jgi:transcriptional regulator with XRE-family HTH domain
MNHHRMTQTALAAGMGVTQPSVCRWLSGRRPRKITTIAIAAFLNLDLDWLRSGQLKESQGQIAAKKEKAGMRDGGPPRLTSETSSSAANPTTRSKTVNMNGSAKEKPEVLKHALRLAAKNIGPSGKTKSNPSMIPVNPQKL